MSQHFYSVDGGEGDQGAARAGGKEPNAEEGGGEGEALLLYYHSNAHIIEKYWINITLPP